MAMDHSLRGEAEQAQACWLRALQSRGLALFETVRSAALEEITEHGDAAQVWRAIAVALDDPYHIMRAKAVMHVAQRFGKEAPRQADVVRALQSALSDGVLTVRMAAVKGIEELAAPVCLPLLKRAVDNENWEVRENAVWVAGRCGATEALMSRAAADEHADVRKAIARPVGSVRSAAATQLLLRVADRAPEVRSEAVSGLRGRAAEPAVRRALEGSLTDWHVSPGVVPILREQGWKPARERDTVHEQLRRAGQPDAGPAPGFRHRSGAARISQVPHDRMRGTRSSAWASRSNYRSWWRH
jgi:HEAT repeat protein